jgi:hypothetical protein
MLNLMTDAPEVRRRMHRLVTRVTRRDAYGTLLATGQVIVGLKDVDDPAAWRAEIRRQARADRIKVRTGLSGAIVWALLSEAGASEGRIEESRRYMRSLSLVMPDVSERRHQPKVVLRDGDEALFQCERCDAFGYLDSSAQHPAVGGDLFEEDCPHDGPPRVTALTFIS